MTQRGRSRDGLVLNRAFVDYLRSLPGAVALWPLHETSGSNADEVVNNNDGTYSGPTLANALTPAGTYAPYFDGINDAVEIYSAGFNGVFNPALFTVMILCRFDGVWGDANFYTALQIGVDVNNRILLYKANSANVWRVFFSAGGSAAQRDNSSAPTDYFVSSMTGDKAGNVLRMFFNNAQIGADSAYSGTWAGALTTGWTDIGSLGGALYFKGWEAYVFVANQAYSPAQIAEIYARLG